MNSAHMSECTLAGPGSKRVSKYTVAICCSLSLPSLLFQHCSTALWFLCRQFGGYAKEADYVSHAAKLKAALGSDAAYHKDSYLCNGYDPPMKPYGRRNEVWFVKE